MVELSSETIKYYLNLEQSRYQTTKKGNALEDLICYMIGKIPGLYLKARNPFNSSKNQELDLAFWNKRYRSGLDFLPNIVAIECKNWERPVSGQQVSWFVQKLKNRNLHYGILVARNGIAGDYGNTKGAHSVIEDALRDGISIIVITKKEIENITDADEIVKLLEEKVSNLMIYVKVN